MLLFRFELAKANLNVLDRNNNTPLCIALTGNSKQYNNTLTIITDLLKAGADPNLGRIWQTEAEPLGPRTIYFSPLCFAIQKCPTVAAILLDHGANPNGTNAEDGINAEDSMSTKLPLMLAIEMNNLSLVQKLLDKGANINQKDTATGETALHAATREGSRREAQTIDIINLLFARGADIHARNNEGNTALHIGAKYAIPGSIINLLIANGARVNEPGENGHTPLHLSF